MFDNELRECRNQLNDLQRKIERLISNYESSLKSLNREFQKVDGVAEKQIDEMLATLEKDITNLIKDYRRTIDQQSTAIKKEIDKQEQEALSYLEAYKKKMRPDFDDKVSTLCLVKGEL